MKINRGVIICVYFLILIGIATGDLTCWIEDSTFCGSQGIELLRMKNLTNGHDNAHAQQVNFTTPYGSVLCCNSTGNAITNSSGTAFLNLSADTNAHVQASNETTAAYAYPAFISVGSSSPECNAYIDGCPASYICLVSIASRSGGNVTNAHVSSCGRYDTEVCCQTPNSPPDNVTLYEPFNGNATLFNRTITFQWLNTTDPDGDALTYNIQVKQCGTSDLSTCNPDTVDFSTFTQEGEIDITGITEGTNITEYISMVEVAADQNYTWRVRAADDAPEYGGWSENWTFVAQSTVMFTIFDENMSFGSMNPNEVNDTTDNDPYPFRVRNDGNILTDFNITVDTAEDWLWDRYVEASSYFQYSIDNATAYSAYAEENASFNWSDSATTPTWFNIPLTNYSANIRQLNYSDIMDEAEIDVRIQVPSDEPAGDKGSTVRITGWVSA